MNIQPLTSGDLHRFVDRAGYIVPKGGLVVGYSARIGEGIVGVGFAWNDVTGRTWVVVDVGPELIGRAMILHRMAVRFLARFTGIDRPVYALKSEHLPTAKRWLTRLGFQNTGERINDREVWVRWPG